MASTATVPLVYRVIFTYIDPAFCLLGVATHLLDPINTTRGYSPLFLNPPATETIHLLDSMAGFFAMLFVVEGILLRLRPNDPAVWRTVQLGGVFVDLFMTLAALRALRADNRMDMSAWRGDDWRLVAGNAGMGLVRIACALGLGFGPPPPATKGKKTS